MKRLPIWLTCASALCASAAAQDAPGAPFPVELRLSGGARVETIAWRNGADVYVDRAALMSLGIEPLAGETVLLSSVPGLTWREDAAAAAIDLACTPQCFARRTITTQAPPIEPALAAHGAFLNLDLAFTAQDGGADAAGAFELVYFSPAGLGEMSWTSGAFGAGLTRLETRWTIDAPAARVRARFGDGVVRGGASGAPFRFGGVQIARDFSLDPGFVSFPLPSLTGAAATPSTVDLYVDGALRLRERVEAGPFTIPDAPVLTGAGIAQIVVTDALGRETVISQPFYASAAMLRSGLSDFAFTAGAERERFAQRSNEYGRGFVSALYRYGLSDAATIEARAEIAGALGGAGIALSLADARAGQLDLAWAGSTGVDGDGWTASASWMRAGRALSYGAHIEAASDEFRRLGGPRAPPPRFLARMSSAFDTPLGAATLAATWRDERDAPALRTFALSYTPPRTWGPWSLHALYADGDDDPILSVGLGFSVSLDGGVSAGVALDYANPDTSLRMGADRPPPQAGGYGWRARTRLGDAARADAGLSYRGAHGDARFDVSYARARTGARAQYAAGLVFMDGAIFAGRPVRESFALVDVGAPGVGILRDNRRVGVSGADGRLLVAGLRAYEPNRIALEIDDLPFDAQVGTDALVVAPPARSGVRVRFPMYAMTRETRVLDEWGAPLPPGAMLTRVSDGARFPIGGDGRAFLALSETEERFDLENGACSVRAPAAALIGEAPLICRRPG